MFVHFTPGHSASVWGAVLESNASWETTENFRHPQLQLLSLDFKPFQLFMVRESCGRAGCNQSCNSFAVSAVSTSGISTQRSPRTASVL